MSGAPAPLRVGVAGLGRAFMLMAPTLLAHRGIEVVAAADPRPEARRQFEIDFGPGARSYATVAALCADPAIEAIYVATPHQMHVAHVGEAARAGKHVLVEKPMALALDDCRAMIAAAEAAGVVLIVGPSHGHDAPYAQARRFIDEGRYGPVRMVTALNYTDFLYRPRRPEELDTSLGGGVIWSQAAHQVDVVRLLGGGRVRGVRATTGRWDDRRPTEGAYTATLTFEDGAVATMVYSGYGHFDSDAFQGWTGEFGEDVRARVHGAARAALRTIDTREDEARLKETRAYGKERPLRPAAPRRHSHFGLVLVSCERADLRPGPDGVTIYADDAVEHIAMPPATIPHGEALDELIAAVRHGVAAVHSGAWGLATVEVLIAMLASAEAGEERCPSEQVGVPRR